MPALLMALWSAALFGAATPASKALLTATEAELAKRSPNSSSTGPNTPPKTMAPNKRRRVVRSIAQRSPLFLISAGTIHRAAPKYKKPAS